MRSVFIFSRSCGCAFACAFATRAWGARAEWHARRGPNNLESCIVGTHCLAYAPKEDNLNRFDIQQKLWYRHCTCLQEVWDPPIPPKRVEDHLETKGQEVASQKGEGGQRERKLKSRILVLFSSFQFLGIAQKLKTWKQNRSPTVGFSTFGRLPKIENFKDKSKSYCKVFNLWEAPRIENLKPNKVLL